jgi:anti-sigma B factor antagonist
MQLTERVVNGVAIIDVAGDLRVPSENPAVLREKVVAVLNRGERHILLNFENLQFMDSSCLGEIVESYKTAAAKGAILKLAHTGYHLRSVLETTALASIFESYETENEAIASFAAAPKT